MEPNCCPYCRKVLTDEEVKRMYKRYCVSQRKDRRDKPPALAKFLKPAVPTEADLKWARQEIVARGIRVDYSDQDFQG